MGSYKFLTELETTKNHQTEMKNTATEMKNTLEGVSSRLSDSEERVSELEDRAVEITARNHRKLRESNPSPNDQHQKLSNLCPLYYLSYSEEENRRVRTFNMMI